MQEDVNELVWLTEKLRKSRQEYFALNPEWETLHRKLDPSDEDTARYRLLTLAQKSLLNEWNDYEQQIGAKILYILAKYKISPADLFKNVPEQDGPDPR